MPIRHDRADADRFRPPPVSELRRARDKDRPAILAIVNAAAEAYRGVIPADRFDDPYMGAAELDREIAAGVEFWVLEEPDGTILGAMGVQPVQDVVLIRHAYVLPERQGSGVGRALLEHLRRATGEQMLVGTWASAEWAIRFYRRNGFADVGPERTAELLRRYWDIPERQIETSVVLASPPLP